MSHVGCRSGIEAVGTLEWGTHFCHLYQTRNDLLDTLVPFFAAGLENNEQCLWVTSEPLGAEEATRELTKRVSDLQSRIDRGQIQIIDHSKWHTRTGKLDADSLLRAWVDAEQAARARGYNGLRATGNVSFLKTRQEWRGFEQYEARVSETFAGRRLIGLCNCELSRMNTELEQRVRERTAELEQALRERDIAARAKDEFLAILGHELRNPLAPMMNALQVMRLRGIESREQDILGRQLAHLEHLVDDLLDVSRIAQGRIELHRRPVELSHVVIRAIELVSPFLDQRQQTLDVDVPREGLLVDVDVERMAQVFGNLLTNASKYSDPRSRILLTARREESQVLCSVRDEGMGIAPEMLQTIFNSFVQQPQTLDRARGGLGLGLAIVRSLVAQHDGSVRAESEGIGCGSEFIVELPLCGPG